MLSLTSQRTQFDIVISDLSRCKQSYINSLDGMSKYGFTYYAINHDKDVDSKGELKRSHLHIVLCSMKRLRVKQLLNILSDTFITNVENIQVQEVVSLCGSIQYLIHLNDLNKYQYDKSLIITNDESNLDGYLMEVPSIAKLSTEKLVALILDDKLNRVELMKSIGIGNYAHYRYVINDLYESLKPYK